MKGGRICWKICRFRNKTMKSEFTFLFSILIVGGVLAFYLMSKEKKIETFFTEEIIREQEMELFSTEDFIGNWLTNDNGTLATYIKDGDLEDVDLVKGRESLSESLGLYMEYALLADNQALFDDSYRLLMQYFIEPDGFVNWKLAEDGQSEVFANALVDDLRISLALFQAGKKWGEPRYEKTATQIGHYTAQSNVYNDTLTDYYVKKEGLPSEVVTLSYIEPSALTRLAEENLLDPLIYKNMLDILEHAPLDGPFYPKAFNSKHKEYVYDTKINLIDQSLVALYRARSGFSTTKFMKFIKKEFKQNGVIFGQYDRLTKKPIVEYESPAIYGWLILYSLEIGEEEFAQKLFQRMVQFKSHESAYYGGYSVYQDDTHIFDNLLPLIAEKELWNEGFIK